MFSMSETFSRFMPRTWFDKGIVDQDFEKQSAPIFKMAATKAVVVLAAGAAISSMSAIGSPLGGAYVGQATIVASMRQERFADGELAPLNQWADVISMIRSRPNIPEPAIDDPDPAF